MHTRKVFAHAFLYAVVGLMAPGPAAAMDIAAHGHTVTLGGAIVPGDGADFARFLA